VTNEWDGRHPPPAPQPVPERRNCDDSRRLQDELARVDKALGVSGEQARLEVILGLLARPTVESMEVRLMRLEEAKNQVRQGMDRLFAARGRILNAIEGV
jgi:hypothetical protein